MDTLEGYPSSVSMLMHFTQGYITRLDCSLKPLAKDFEMSKHWVSKITGGQYVVTNEAVVLAKLEIAETERVIESESALHKLCKQILDAIRSTEEDQLVTLMSFGATVLQVTRIPLSDIGPQLECKSFLFRLDTYKSSDKLAAFKAGAQTAPERQVNIRTLFEVFGVATNGSPDVVATLRWLASPKPITSKPIEVIEQDEFERFRVRLGAFAIDRTVGVLLSYAMASRGLSIEDISKEDLEALAHELLGDRPQFVDISRDSLKDEVHVFDDVAEIIADGVSDTIYKKMQEFLKFDVTPDNVLWRIKLTPMDAKILYVIATGQMTRPADIRVAVDHQMTSDTTIRTTTAEVEAALNRLANTYAIPLVTLTALGDVAGYPVEALPVLPALTCLGKTHLRSKVVVPRKLRNWREYATNLSDGRIFEAMMEYAIIHILKQRFSSRVTTTRGESDEFLDPDHLVLDATITVRELATAMLSIGGLYWNLPSSIAVLSKKISDTLDGGLEFVNVINEDSFSMTYLNLPARLMETHIWFGLRAVGSRERSNSEYAHEDALSIKDRELCAHAHRCSTVSNRHHTTISALLGIMQLFYVHRKSAYTGPEIINAVHLQEDCRAMGTSALTRANVKRLLRGLCDDGVLVAITDTKPTRYKLA